MKLRSGLTVLALGHATQVHALLRPGVGGDGSETRMDAVPALGQHTEAVLAELGRSPADIAALRQARAI